jgi:hypothetical protein
MAKAVFDVIWSPTGCVALVVQPEERASEVFSIPKGNLLTGELDTGNPPVQFGGRVVPTCHPPLVQLALHLVPIPNGIGDSCATVSPRLSGDVPDIRGFLGAIWGAVGAQDVVEPQRGFAGVFLVPGIPGIDRLGLAGDEAPAIGGNILLFHIAQVRGKGAPVRTGHIFGAEERTTKRAQGFDGLLHVRQLAVAVVGNDIAILKLDLLRGIQLIHAVPRSEPDTGGQRLGRMGLARPGKNLRQEGIDEIHLVLRFQTRTARGAAVAVVGFVPNIPAVDAFIFGEMLYKTGDIILEKALLFRMR